MVNQVELHPYFAQPEALATMKYYNVQPEAWAPLGGGRHNPFENNLLQSIADAHQKSISQVILRWNIQREWSLFRNRHINSVSKKILLFGISH